MGTTYKLNDRVVHKREGLSDIVSTTLMGSDEYFLLKATRGDGEMIYVPVNRCEDIIRPIMSEEEADELIKFMKDIALEINPNTKQRRDGYKRMLNNGDIKDIAYLSRQLFYHYALPNVDSHLGLMDIEMLKKAHNMLMDELSITFNKAREEIETFIKNKIAI